MSGRIFISAINLKSAGISTLEDVHAIINKSKKVELTKYKIGDEEILVGEPALTASDPNYPTRSNEKVMRKEVIAAFISIRELIQETAIQPQDAMNIPLYMASGVCSEKQQEDMYWLSLAIKASAESKTVSERNKKLASAIPPLLALRTLTNAAESFVAETSKLAGNNTTFGITSISTYYALSQACSAISNEETEMAVVGGCSRGGVVSYLMFSNFFEDTVGWKDSTCSGFILVESEKSLMENHRKPLCEIVLLDHSQNVPSLSGRSSISSNTFSHVLNKEICIHSGAFCESTYVLECRRISTLWNQSFSWFPFLGNNGTGGMILNLAAGISYLKQNKNATVDCVDYDPYGRESLVRIKHPLAG